MINPQWGFNPIIIRMLFAVTLFQQKQFSDNFGNLLFLAILISGAILRGLNEGFLGSSFSMIVEGMIEPPK
jgi:hypothetical protein